MNRLYFLLGASLTSLSVVGYVNLSNPSSIINTKTETIVRMVNVPFTPSDYETQAKEIK